MKNATSFFKLSALAMILALLLSTSTFAQCSGGSKAMGQGGETMMSTDDQPTEASSTDMEDPEMIDTDMPPMPEPADMPAPEESE